MKFASIFALTLLAVLPAVAQVTYVASNGNDFNGCYAQSSPCRTFLGAYNQGLGGMIKALDAADYGPINVTTPIIIDGSGVGFIEATAVHPNGVSVQNVANAGLVEIRNLAIHIPPYSSSGISTTNSYVNIENVSISGKVASPGVIGVSVFGYAVTIHGVTVTGAATGIVVDSGSVNISDSVVRYSNSGILVYGGSAATEALIERSKMIYCATGLTVQNAAGAATARISDSVITGNTLGVATVSGGQIISFRNNTWAGNTTDGSTPFSASLR